MLKGLVASLLIFSSAALAETKTYKVEGMHCESCVMGVKEKLCGMEGIAKCDVEVGKVTLTSDNKIDDNAVTNAIQAAGYKIATHHEGEEHGGMKCDHKDAKTCGGDGCGCNHDGKTCTCDHSKGGCSCEHKGDHKTHKKAKKKGA
jgi:periplasmic mercuric ion binding protein